MMDLVDSENSSFDEAQETRNAVLKQNRKKKKSGGFQSMGKNTDSHCNFTDVLLIYFLYRIVL